MIYTHMDHVMASLSGQTVWSFTEYIKGILKTLTIDTCTFN